MDGRLVLSRRRQDGRTADHALSLAERMLGRLPGPRAAWVLAWAAIPVDAGLLPSGYVASVGARPLPVRLLAGLVFAYVVVLAFWAVGRFTVAHGGGGRPGGCRAVVAGRGASQPYRR